MSTQQGINYRRELQKLCIEHRSRLVQHDPKFDARRSNQRLREGLVEAGVTIPTPSTTRQSTSVSELDERGDGFTEKKHLINHQWQAVEIIGKGGFGIVYRGQGKNESVALKINLKGNSEAVLKHESEMIRELQGIIGVPRLHWYGKTRYVNLQRGCLVIELFGRSLNTIKIDTPSKDYLYGFGREMIEILQRIHERGIVHRDIKPSNFVTHGDRLVLIDYGLAMAYNKKQEHPKFAGTYKYAPIAAHKKISQMPKDDLESVVYTLMSMAKIELPWGEIPKHRRPEICGLKEGLKIEELTKDYPALTEIYQIIRNLSVDDVVPYEKLLERLPSSNK